MINRSKIVQFSSGNRPTIVWCLLSNRLIGAAERHADLIYRQFIDGSEESIEGELT